jgi:hypothetical protein
MLLVTIAAPHRDSILVQSCCAQTRAAIQFKLILLICGEIPQQIIPDRAQVLTRDEAFGFTMSPEATRRVSRLPRQLGSYH